MDGTRLGCHLTESEFENRLEELLQAGHASGIDVEGGYKVSDPSDGTYWGVEIFEVVPSE